MYIQVFGSNSQLELFTETLTSAPTAVEVDDPTFNLTAIEVYYV